MKEPCSRLLQEYGTIRANPLQFPQASWKLRNHKPLVLHVVRQHENLLQYASKHFKKDPDVMLVAVTDCGDCLQFAHASMRNAKTIMLHAVQSSLVAYAMACTVLQDDAEILQAALEHDGFALAVCFNPQILGPDHDSRLLQEGDLSWPHQRIHSQVSQLSGIRLVQVLSSRPHPECSGLGGRTVEFLAIYEQASACRIGGLHSWLGQAFEQAST